MSQNEYDDFMADFERKWKREQEIIRDKLNEEREREYVGRLSDFFKQITRPDPNQ